jgi:tRNA (cytidine/uridine-2'-O-)-methyltransferase
MINLVLFEPEIPQNTGNIMRTCVGTNTHLHLIEPLGFRLDEHHIKRSGVNYIKYLKYDVYMDFDDFIEKRIKSNPNARMFFLTRYGRHHLHEVDCHNKDLDYYFILGKESTGIPKEILKDYLDACIRLPMTDKVRALNVSNVAAIMVYEALRQQGFPGLYEYEPSADKEGFKGEDYLER